MDVPFLLSGISLRVSNRLELYVLRFSILLIIPREAKFHPEDEKFLGRRRVLIISHNGTNRRYAIPVTILVPSRSINFRCAGCTLFLRQQTPEPRKSKRDYREMESPPSRCQPSFGSPELLGRSVLSLSRSAGEMKPCYRDSFVLQGPVLSGVRIYNHFSFER